MDACDSKNAGIRSDVATEGISLSDGRHLAFVQHGRPDGFPVFFFHGIPNSRLTVLPDPEVTENLDIRIIAPDRPGIGRSDAAPGRSVLDWTADIEELADRLDLGRFGVIGLSAGGPYALGCGYAFPERVTKIAVVSGAPPLDAPGVTKEMNRSNRVALWVARHLPILLKPILIPVARSAVNDPAATIRRLSEAFAEPDREILGRRDLLPGFIRDLREAYRQGPAGHAEDLRAVARPWGFELEDVEAPVRLWQGTEDRNAPESGSRYMARRLPRGELLVRRGEGHFLLYEHWSKILSDVADRPDARHLIRESEWGQACEWRPPSAVLA